MILPRGTRRRPQISKLSNHVFAVFVLLSLCACSAAQDDRSECLRTGRDNTPYCPHTPGNLESPTAGRNYTAGDDITITWNKQWSPFASAGAVDIYICPQAAPTNCSVIMKFVQTSFEKVDGKTQLNMTPGEYFVVVVQSGGSPEVKIDERGVSFFIRAPKATATTTTTGSTPSTSSSTSTDSKSPITSSSPATEFSRSNGLAFILGFGVGGALLVAISAFAFIYRYHRHHQSDMNELLLATDKIPPPTTQSSPRTNPNMISNTEAIIIANSFKLALKKPIDDDDEDEDLSTMISQMGMQAATGDADGKDCKDNGKDPKVRVTGGTFPHNTSGKGGSLTRSAGGNSAATLSVSPAITSNDPDAISISSSTSSIQPSGIVVKQLSMGDVISLNMGVETVQSISMSGPSSQNLSPQTAFSSSRNKSGKKQVRSVKSNKSLEILNTVKEKES